MKKIILACACILALSVGGAFAQTQPAPDASSEGNVGPSTTKHHKMTKHHARMAKHHANVTKGMTTGTGSGMSRSKSMGTSSEGKQSGGRY
jgi:hypothetical protein